MCPLISVDPIDLKLNRELVHAKKEAVRTCLKLWLASCGIPTLPIFSSLLQDEAAAHWTVPGGDSEVSTDSPAEAMCTAIDWHFSKKSIML